MVGREAISVGHDFWNEHWEDPVFKSYCKQSNIYYQSAKLIA